LSGNAVTLSEALHQGGTGRSEGSFEILRCAQNKERREGIGISFRMNPNADASKEME